MSVAVDLLAFLRAYLLSRAGWQSSEPGYPLWEAATGTPAPGAAGVAAVCPGKLGNLGIIVSSSGTEPGGREDRCQ